METKIITNLTKYDTTKQRENLRQSYKDILDGDIDGVLDDLAAGISFKVIVEKRKVKLWYFHIWREESEHKKDIEAALKASAHTFEQGARDILVEGIYSGTENMAEAGMRRELSKALQFSASKRNQFFYGNKKEEEKVEQVASIESKEEYAFILEQLKKKKLAGELNTEPAKEFVEVKAKKPHEFFDEAEEIN